MTVASWQMTPLFWLHHLCLQNYRIQRSRLAVCFSAPFSQVTLPLKLTIVGVVAGTGSIAASFRLVDGIPQELARIGGWGWMLGDEGSGFHVGKEAVKQLLQEFELAVLNGNELPSLSTESNKNTMRSQILTLFGVSTAPDLLPLVGSPEATISSNSTSPSFASLMSLTREKRLSQLSPIVFQSAFPDSGEGDPLAQNVLRVTSDAIAEQIQPLLEDADSPSISGLRVKANSTILVFGGSLVGIPAYRNLVVDALKRRGHDFAVVEHINNAADTGAIALAQRYGHMQ